MTKSEFISKVLSILNEADTSITGATLIGADNTNIRLYIENLYPPAWRRAVGIPQIPRNWFALKSFKTSSPVVNATDGTGYVTLPSDFLQLVRFKMTLWKIACTNALEETEAINAKQRSKFTRGTIFRPVCVMRMITDNNNMPRKVMYYYSLPETSQTNAGTHQVEEAVYIPNVTQMPSTIDVNNNMLEVLAYLTASTLLVSLEKTQLATEIDKTAIQLISNTQ